MLDALSARRASELAVNADDRDELRRHVRDEQPPADAVIVVRGGPASPERLLEHAIRTHDAFVLDGQPIWGTSQVVNASPRPREGRLTEAMATAPKSVVAITRCPRLRDR